MCLFKYHKKCSFKKKNQRNPRTETWFGFRKAASTCQGAAMARKTNALESGLSFRRCLMFPVSTRYIPMATAGNTSPISPLVNTFKAHVIAKPQQVSREGGFSSKERKKKRKPTVNHSPTSKSGIRNRVKRYGPTAVPNTRAE